MRWLRALLIAVIGLVLMPALALAQGYTGPPSFNIPTTGLVLPYSVGTGSAGGRQVAINAGSLTMVANRTNCASPQFVSCNIIYWDGHSVVISVTGDPSTAFAVGTQPIAYVTTRGSTIVSLVGASQTPYSVPQGVPRPGLYQGIVLPLCNAVRRTGCQMPLATLSGY